MTRQQTAPRTAQAVTYVRDCYGRLHRVGETDRELPGPGGRRLVLWLAWGAMLGAGVLQYGFALTALPLHGARGTFAVLAVWTVCQAAAVPVAHLLRARRKAEPGGLVLLGGGCCAGALAIAAAVAESANPAGAGGSSALLVGYGLLGGTGAGLVYAGCTATAARWYPERAPAAVAFATGGYAYGAVLPLLLLLVLGLHGSAVAPVLGGVAGLSLLAALGCGALLRDPPEHWWPAGIDPRQWTLDRHLNRSLRHNRPPLWEAEPRPGAGSGTWRLLYAATALTSAALLFDLGRLAADLAAGPGTVGLWACAAFAAGSGLGRGAVGALAERFGRGTVLATALLLGALAQPGLVGAGPAAAVCCAALAGGGTGGCYPVLVGLLRGFYGRHGGQRAFALLYTAKAFGGAAGCALAAFVPGTGGTGTAAAVLLAAALAVRAARRPRPLLRLLPAAPTVTSTRTSSGS
ncbi:hypothetical protein ACEZCY_07140 [Streptacidiphilus sp. N1-12]|uniref:Uncharacterized protein n=2 Tax=Streptacidiphilus alkalitolerans TaxID=3342712 RepID=A0ABV6VLI4_9ACTN